MKKYNIGDTITAEFNAAFEGNVVVTGVIREFKGSMICCNEVVTGKPFFCYECEVRSKK